jgi:hypothetical protein
MMKTMAVKLGVPCRVADVASTGHIFMPHKCLQLFDVLGSRILVLGLVSDDASELDGAKQTLKYKITIHWVG